MKKNKKLQQDTFQACKPQEFSKILPISETLSGALCRTDSMQGRPQGAEGKPCLGIKRPAKALRKSFEKCNECQTASKYYGGSFDNKPISNWSFLIGIDYLQLNLTGEVEFASDTAEHEQGNFKIIHTERGSKHFEAIFDVFYKDELFGQVNCFPRASKVLDPKTIQFKMNNQRFYDGSDLQQILQEFFATFNLVYRNITRLDVFMDSYGFQNGITLNHLDYLIDEGVVISNTRVKDKAKYAIKKDGKFISSGFSWGSRSSFRYLRIYNKTEELEIKGKKYIRRFHEANGLKDRDVFRFEYELKNDFFKCIDKFEFEDIFSKEGQFEILDTARKGHFSFVWEDGQKRNDRKKPLELFDWKAMRQLPEIEFNYERRRKLSQGHTKQGVQRTIRGLFKQYITKGQTMKALHSMFEMIHDCDLGEWFLKKEPDYKKEFLRLRYYQYPFDEKVYKNDWEYCTKDYPL